MNENIDLTKILKNCPKETVLWSDNYGEVHFLYIETKSDEPIVTRRSDGYTSTYTKEGWHSIDFPASCLLWPSQDCRDWSKFTAPWYKKEKFDPKTLQPFDRVLACLGEHGIWCCELFSFIEEGSNLIKCCGAYYKYCVPYNEETKNLVGTNEEPSEYYRYWED